MPYGACGWALSRSVPRCRLVDAYVDPHHRVVIEIEDAADRIGSRRHRRIQRVFEIPERLELVVQHRFITGWRARRHEGIAATFLTDGADECVAVVGI